MAGKICRKLDTTSTYRWNGNMAILLKLTKPELVFIQDTLDSCREEFDELVYEEDWYVTDLNERCLAAFNILKYAEKQEVEDSETSD